MDAKAVTVEKEFVKTKPAYLVFSRLAEKNEFGSDFGLCGWLRTGEEYLSVSMKDNSKYRIRQNEVSNEFEVSSVASDGEETLCGKMNRNTIQSGEKMGQTYLRMVLDNGKTFFAFPNVPKPEKAPVAPAKATRKQAKIQL